MKGKARSYRVAKFFATKFEKPQSLGNAKYWNDMVDKAYDRVQDNLKQQKEGQVQMLDDSFKVASRLKAQEVVKRPREELAKRTEDRNTKRRLSLKGAAVSIGDQATPCCSTLELGYRMLCRGGALEPMGCILRCCG